MCEAIRKVDTPLRINSSNHHHPLIIDHHPSPIMGICWSIKYVRMVDNPLGDKKKRPQPQTKAALRYMIEQFSAGKKTYGEPNTWDVSLVTDMSRLFYAITTFNAPIDLWVTSQVTNMNGMFERCRLFNQPITMDTSQVTNMGYMFLFASSFNQPITMDTSNVINMVCMFSNASSFNQPITMDTSQVTNMGYMFSNASSFNQPITMDTSKVTDMKHMFRGASLFNQPITMDTSQVTDMGCMFCCASSFNQPITMDTSQVTFCFEMFAWASSFNQPITMDFSKVGTIKDRNGRFPRISEVQMFRGASSMTHPVPWMMDASAFQKHNSCIPKPFIGRVPSRIKSHLLPTTTANNWSNKIM